MEYMGTSSYKDIHNCVSITFLLMKYCQIVICLMARLIDSILTDFNNTTLYIGYHLLKTYLKFN